MDKIIECVPNFSTSDQFIINEITASIKSVPNIKLLNVEPDPDYNRTVITFVGTPDKVGEAAFQGISKATELIDMTTHKGEHPRMGACDVTPFVPVRGVTIDECIEIARHLAEKVANELGVPTYLYGKAASTPEREKLSTIRKGQYEGFKEKIKDPEWKPDFGSAEFNEKSGAYTIGVRDFLIAYNINIESSDVSIAKEVAELIRETGRLVEKNGEKVRVPGMLKGIQGMGFPLERNNRKLTQVSMNVVDFKNLAKVHEAFDLVKKLSEERGTTVTGSEIVGLVPLDSIFEAGKSYSPNENDQAKLIEIAISKLGLSDLEEFNPNKKIIELIIDDQKLVDLNVSGFLDALSSDKPAPGGGSVSALGGSLAAALGVMVSRLTIGKEKYKDVENDMKVYTVTLGSLLEELQSDIDEDTNAFNQVMASFRISKDNPERPSMIQKAMIYAAEVPMKVAEKCYIMLDTLEEIVKKGNSNAITDAGVAALFAEAAINGALYNVKINLTSIKDDSVKENFQNRISEITSNLNIKSTAIKEIIEKEIS